jgi:hypothetical protein
MLRSLKKRHLPQSRVESRPVARDVGRHGRDAVGPFRWRKHASSSVLRNRWVFPSEVEGLTADKSHVEIAEEAALASISSGVQTLADEAVSYLSEGFKGRAISTVTYSLVSSALERVGVAASAAIIHATDNGNEASALALLYFWSNAVDDEFQLSLVT